MTVRRAAHEALARCEHLLTKPSAYTFTGHPGLYLLLQTLRGDVDLVGCEARLTSGTMRTTRWNRQFGLFAYAVLLGRAGRRQEAIAAADQARQAEAAIAPPTCRPSPRPAAPCFAGPEPGSTNAVARNGSRKCFATPGCHRPRVRRA